MHLNYYVQGNKKYNKSKAHDDKAEKETQEMMVLQAADMIQNLNEDFDPQIARTVFFDQEINEESSTQLRATLMSMVAEDKETPIRLMLGSPGGGLYESLAIYDTIQMLPCEVIAVCSGKVMSGGILILLACAKRYSTPNTTFMIHHGFTTIQGSIPELWEQVKEVSNLNDQMLDAIIKETKITRAQLESWLVKDHYLNVMDAEKFGLIHGVIKNLGDLDEVK